MKQSKAVVTEMFVLRTLACLSILLLHVFDRVYLQENEAINSISVLLTFGTPAFVFISEFIIAYSYRDRPMTSFWKKRLQFIFLPYVFFGTFYAFALAFQEAGTSSALGGTFFTYFWRHLLLGDYHGYFILIIFQFYALHLLFHSYLKKTSPKKVIGFSFLINSLYLLFFNFVPPMNVPFADYIWSKYYWVPFLGWLFYFSLAFYCGYYYQEFRQLMVKYRHWTTAAVLVFGTVSISLYQLEIFDHPSSKRIDMLFFTTSMIFFLYSHTMLLSKIPRFFTWISQYSFGIYLFHPFFLGIFAMLAGKYALLETVPSVLMAVILFFTTIGLTAFTIQVFNRIPFGAYMVGKVGIGRRTAPPAAPLSPIETNTVKRTIG